MKKPLLFISIFAVISIISVYFIYQHFVPDEFLTEEDMRSEFSLADRERTIQDVIKVDDQTYFVPYQFGEEAYGASVWVWLDGKWENVGDGTTSGLHLLSTDQGKEYVYWNVHPDDRVEKWETVMKFDRNYRIFSPDGKVQHEIYYPGIEFKKEFESGNKTYGIVELPEEWSEQAAFEEEFPTEPSMIPSKNAFTYEWQAFDEDGEVIVHLENTLEEGGGGTFGGNYARPLSQVSLQESEE
ncbi:hypothetical protein [Jeotgalibacillus sp. R-1-5s-1]|uniref:hypothetical protein n=1 Tax=Jeotgalibacillus sp. R-1-5s-1 TaxID=2555897 RepID=UPI001069A85A|nr:hypothetical protein [Jeotgalibacillus sp. R-1-5s-1]TFD93612.1 hypothetical protein E2491_14315 [Jeotgalibacillus sp. R-1-5s-1]